MHDARQTQRGFFSSGEFAFPSISSNGSKHWNIHLFHYRINIILIKIFYFQWTGACQVDNGQPSIERVLSQHSTESIPMRPPGITKVDPNQLSTHLWRYLLFRVPNTHIEIVIRFQSIFFFLGKYDRATLQVKMLL